MGVYAASGMLTQESRLFVQQCNGMVTRLPLSEERDLAARRVEVAMDGVRGGYYSWLRYWYRGSMENRQLKSADQYSSRFGLHRAAAK